MQPGSGGDDVRLLGVFLQKDFVVGDSLGCGSGGGLTDLFDFFLERREVVGGLQRDRFDDDRHYRNDFASRVLGMDPGFGIANGVDRFHALDHFPEYGVSGAAPRLVQRSVVDHVDVELGSRGIGFAGPSHGDGASDVFEAVFPFVFDREPQAFFFFVDVFRKAAALDHENRHDAVENRALIEFALGVF